MVRQRRRNPEIAGWWLVLLLLVPTIVLGTTLHGRRYDFRPRSDRRWDSVITDHDARQRRYQNWKRMCAWVRENTPVNALMLTPRNQQTFKWYAQRAEVLNWKDVPQDAKNVVEWRRRMNQWFPKPVIQHGITALSDERILDLARKYKVQYIVLERGRMLRRLGPAFRQVYPSGIEENSEFAVFEVITSTALPTGQLAEPP